MLRSLLILLLLTTLAQVTNAQTPPSYVTKWGSAGSGNGQFASPYGVAAAANGNVYVADAFNHRIQVYDPNGAFLFKWGSNGTGDGQFNSPTGIAIDASGNVFVVESGNRVQKFTSNGTFITKWGSLGSGNGQFNLPRTVTIDSGGNVYVVEQTNQRIQKFTNNGVFITKWGSAGTGNGQFDNPWGIDVDASDNVYVSDTNNSRVQKFTSAGVFLTKWGTAGSGNGQFNNPRGVEVDADQNIYVTELNNRVQKFTNAGVFIAKWGSLGSGDGQFNSPQDIAIDGPWVYVADTSNNRIQRFGYVYTWVGAANAAWTTASNWSPSRSAPATNDVLQFNGGGTATPTGVPTATIGQLVIANTTTVLLSSASTITLTIMGANGGADLLIAANSSLQNELNSQVLNIRVGIGATGDIFGSMGFSAHAHSVDAADVNGITFESGSSFGSGGAGAPFSASGTPNSIHFLSGSTVATNHPINSPFGLAAPNSKIVLDHGSLFICSYSSATSLDFSGRTYGDFKFQSTNGGVVVSATGSGDVSIDNFTVANSTVNLGMTGNFHLRGNLTVQGAVNFAPASSALVTLDGSGTQTITISGSFATTANQTFGVNNANGILLGSNLNLADATLQLLNGKVTTGPYLLTVGSLGNLIGAGAGTGWVVGRLKRDVPISGSRTFDVGSSSNYLPIALQFNGLDGPFDLTASTNPGDHAQIGTSPIDPGKSVNRYWSLVPAGMPSFTTFGATFNFAMGDVDGGAAPANFETAILAGASWTTLTTSQRTGTSTTVDGATLFGDVVIGELQPSYVSFDGYTVSSLGQAHVAVVDSTLELSGVGSSGNDGLSVDLIESLDFTMQWDPVDNPFGPLDGAFVKEKVFGSVGGVPGQAIGEIVFTKSGSVYQVQTDFSAVGSTTNEVQVWNGPTLVATVTGKAGVLATISNCPISISSIGDSTEIFVARTADTEIFTVSGIPYSGDQIRVLAESPSSAAEFRSRCDLTLKDLAISPSAPKEPTFHKWLIKILAGLYCPRIEQYSGTYNTHNNVSASVLAQSFSSLSPFTLCSVEVNIGFGFCPFATLTVQTGPDENSPILTKLTRSISAGLASKWTTFDVPDVDLLANTTYYVRLSVCPTSIGWSRYTVDAYSRGGAFINGAPVSGDFLFIARGHTLTLASCASAIVRTQSPSGTQNVGQLVRFALSPVPPAGSTFQWTVDGDVLKDYSEHTQNGPWSIDGMDPEDFRNSTIQFYWKPDPSQIYPLNGGSVFRKVQVLITLPGGSKCSSQVTVSVARDNTTLTLQPQDIYLKGHTESDLGPLVEHENWHDFFDPPFGVPNPADPQYGDKFFVFHHGYLSRFDSWRKEFGYPPIQVWDPSTPIPNDQEILCNTDCSRYHTYQPNDVPISTYWSWFTIAGGTGSRSPGYSCSDPSGQKKLYDFVSRNQLGCAVVDPFHNTIHGAIGGVSSTQKRGTMSSPATAPKDGIFWRWHKFVDTIHLNWVNRPGGAPMAVDFFPMVIFRHRVEPPSRVMVAFSRPVTGVIASAVRVNTSPATTVTGSGEGPYIFTGFAVPGLGPMTVQVVGSGIVDSVGAEYPGDLWNYVILAPTGDQDSDGLTNENEIKLFHTNPEAADTDRDGISDNKEIQQGYDPLDPDNPSSSGGGGGHNHHGPPVTTVAVTPNPFAAGVTVQLSLAAPGMASIKVYDVAGRLVRTLLDREVLNTETITWDGHSSSDKNVSSGIYFIRVVTPEKTMIKRIVKVS